MRHLGVDLHSNNLVVCYLSEQGEQSFAKYQLSEIARFQRDLSRMDVVAVEATANCDGQVILDKKLSFDSSVFSL